MECAPVDAKAACLYTNNSRALKEAQARGFNNCLLLDLLGNVAEFGKIKRVHVEGRRSPYAGAERDVPQRHHAAAGDRSVAQRWRHHRETTLSYADFLGADEIASGNFAKVAPIIRIDDRSLQPGPFYNRARKLYWDFARA
jgi:branched-chain amino acid aminotransferase